eukprot:scaffold1.g5417.t1
MALPLSTVIDSERAGEAIAALLALAPPPLVAIALLLLAWTALRVVGGVLSFVWAYFLRPGRNLRSYGSWAVITGATDGIGKAYAAALAKNGLNIVLVSRTEAKLKAEAAELEAKYGVQTRVVSADLTSPDDATIARRGAEAAVETGGVGAALEGLDVGLLVNNAGMSYDHPEYLDALAAGEVERLVAINTVAPTLLCKLVLPGMKARRRGAIINIGSGSATVVPSAPLLSVYAGTKAYIEALSKSLAQEYRSFGITVQNQAPMFVATKLSKIRRAGLSTLVMGRARLDAPFPDAWVRAALRQIGYETSATPFWFHGLQAALVHSVPDWAVNRQVLQLHKNFHAAWHRKQAKREAEAAKAAVGAATASGAPDSPSKYELRKRK